MLHTKEHVFVTTPCSRKVILVVADDQANATWLAQAIKQETSYHTFFAADGSAALQFTRHIKPQLFILDYHPSQNDGIELYQQLHAFRELTDTPAIIIGNRLEQLAINTEEREIVSLRKPLELHELIETIEKILA